MPDTLDQEATTSLEDSLNALPEGELGALASQGAPPSATPPEEPETPAEGAEETEEPAEVEDDGTEWVADQLAKHGIDPNKYRSPDEVFKAFAHLNSKIGERDQHAEIGRMVTEDPENAVETIRRIYGINADQAPPKEPAAEARPSSDASLAEYDRLMAAKPEWDDAWREEVDDEGKLLPSVAGKVRKALLWKQKLDSLEMRDPEVRTKAALRQIKPVKDGSVDELKRELDHFKAIHAQAQQQQQQQAMNLLQQKIVEQHRSRMFKDGAAPTQDNLTPWGKSYWKHLGYAVNRYGAQAVDWDRENAVAAELASKESRDSLPAPRKGATRTAPRTRSPQAAEASRSVTAPAKPGVRDWPAGKSLADALLEIHNGGKDDSFSRTLNR